MYHVSVLVTDLSHVSLSSEHDGLQPIICARYLHNRAKHGTK